MVLAGGIVFLALFVPFVSLFILFFLPLPVILLRLETQDIRYLAVMLAMIFLPLGVVTGWAGWDLVFCASMLLYGYVMGEGWRKAYSREMLVAFGLLASMALWALGLFFISQTEGMNPVAFLEKQAEDILGQVFRMYENMGVPQEALAPWKEATPILQYRMARLFPAMVAALQILAGWLNLLLARGLARRMATDAPDLGFFRNWGIPRMFIWGVVGAGLLTMIPAPYLQTLGVSGLLLFFVMYFLQGMAVLAFFFHAKRIPLFAQTMLYTLIAVQPVLAFPVFMAGLCDTWFNFRKFMQAPR